MRLTTIRVRTIAMTMATIIAMTMAAIIAMTIATTIVIRNGQLNRLQLGKCEVFFPEDLALFYSQIFLLKQGIVRHATGVRIDRLP
jgi:hypothetical protein